MQAACTIEIDYPLRFRPEDIDRVAERYTQGKTVFTDLSGVTQNTKYVPRVVDADRLVIPRGVHLMVFERDSDDDELGDSLNSIRGFHWTENIYTPKACFLAKEVERVMGVIGDVDGTTLFLGVDEVSVDGRFIPLCLEQQTAPHIVLRCDGMLVIFERGDDGYKFVDIV